MSGLLTKLAAPALRSQEFTNPGVRAAFLQEGIARPEPVTAPATSASAPVMTPVVASASPASPDDEESKKDRRRRRSPNIPDTILGDGSGQYLGS